MDGSYMVRTMGDLDDDGYDQAPTYSLFGMGDLEGDGPAASESGYTEGITSNPHVNTTADAIPTAWDGAIVVRPSPAPSTAPVHRPSPPSGGGGGGGGGLAVAPVVAPGMFGDLFGAQTDTIVLAAGLLVLGGLVYLTVTRKKTAPRRRAARR